MALHNAAQEKSALDPLPVCSCPSLTHPAPCILALPTNSPTSKAKKNTTNEPANQQT